MLLRRIILTLTIVLLYLVPAGATENYATIFIFHRFGDKRYPTTSVSLEDFKKEMKFLKEKGYNVISLNKLYEIVSSHRKIPPKTVVITIDDGYRTTMKAYNILKKYHFPFTVFLYMEAAGRYPDFLTINNIETLKKSGLVTFGNHLYSHPNLGIKRIKLPKDKYLRLLQREEKLSRERFKKLLGFEPEYLAFPYGDYDKISLEFFKKKGYKLLLSQDRGSFSGKENPVPRMAVVGSFSTFKKFLRDLNVEPLPVSFHLPKIGLTEENPVEIEFEIENPSNYDHCSVYVSGWGWLPAKKTGKKIKVKEPVSLIKSKTRIGIRCINMKTKNRAEFFFLVLVKKPGKPPVVKN